VAPAQAAVCGLEAVETGPDTRFAELQKRGVGKGLAAQTAGSAHGPWRLSNSPALALALPNAYFGTLGLPRLVAGR
jgi:RNA-directed DNA polymerase